MNRQQNYFCRDERGRGDHRQFIRRRSRFSPPDRRVWNPPTFGNQNHENNSNIPPQRFRDFSNRNHQESGNRRPQFHESRDFVQRPTRDFQRRFDRCRINDPNQNQTVGSRDYNRHRINNGDKTTCGQRSTNGQSRNVQRRPNFDDNAQSSHDLRRSIDRRTKEHSTQENVNLKSKNTDAQYSQHNDEKTSSAVDSSRSPLPVDDHQVLNDVDNISVGIGESCSDCDDSLFDDLNLEDEAILELDALPAEKPVSSTASQNNAEDDFDLDQLQDAIDSIEHCPLSPNISQQSSQHSEKSALSPTVLLKDIMPLKSNTPIKPHVKLTSSGASSSDDKNLSKRVNKKSGLKRKCSDDDNAKKPTNRRSSNDNGRNTSPAKSSSQNPNKNLAKSSNKYKTSDNTDSEFNNRDPRIQAKRKKVTPIRGQKIGKTPQNRPQSKSPKKSNWERGEKTLSPKTPKVRDEKPHDWKKDRKVVMTELNHDMRICVPQQMPHEKRNRRVGGEDLMEVQWREEGSYNRHSRPAENSRSFENLKQTCNLVAYKNTSHFEKKRNKVSELEEGEIIEDFQSQTRVRPILAQPPALQGSNSALAVLDGDYDTMSNMYAPDEDCMSQYITKTNKGNEVEKTDERRVDINNNAEIRKKNNADNPVAAILNLLQCGTMFKTLIAADNFFKVFHKLDFNSDLRSDGQIIVMRLTAKLSQFNKMLELERVVNLSLSKNVIVNNNILDHLFDFFKHTNQSKKIMETLNKIEGRKLMTPRSFEQISNKWNPQLNIHNHRMKFNNQQNHIRPPPNRNPTPQSNLTKFPPKNYMQPAAMSPNTLIYGNSGENVAQNINRSAFKGLKQSPTLKPPSPAKNGVLCKFKSSSEFKSGNMFSQNNAMQSSPNIGNKIMHFNLQNTSESNIGDNSSKMKSVTLRIQEAAKCRDWCSLGRSFGELISLIGPNLVKDELLTAFIGLLTLTQHSDATIFFEFKKSARNYITQNCAEEIRTMDYCLTRIAISLIHSCSCTFAYDILLHMHETKMDYVKNIGILSNSSDRNTPCGNAMKFIKLCMQVDNLNMAATLAKEFFIDHDTKISQVMEQDFQELLRTVAGTCIAKQQYLNAVTCLEVIPIWTCEGSLDEILKSLLKLFLSFETKLDRNVEQMKKVVDMMLNRRMLFQIRSILNETPLNDNSLVFFRYMETKGIFGHPRIYQRPHLVLIPYTMSPVEMALIICRHLMELADFLVEINEKLKPDLPLRIVLIKNIGNLVDLHPLSGKKDSYSLAKDQLIESLSVLMKPRLKIFNINEVNSTKEVLVNVDSDSVGLWMHVNTAYKHTNGNGEVNQIVLKQHVTESVINILSSEISEFRKVQQPVLPGILN